MAKFVRWLGAFGKAQTIEQSIAYELAEISANCARQVAVEALVNNKSYIPHALIGLGVDEDNSQFIKGFLYDCWSNTTSLGYLKSSREDDAVFKNKDKFLKTINNKNELRYSHTEVFFDNVSYDTLILDLSNANVSYDTDENKKEKIKNLKAKGKTLAKKYKLKFIII